MLPYTYLSQPKVDLGPNIVATILGKKSLFVRYCCLLYKLQTEPKVSQVAFELLLLCDCIVDECCFSQSLV